MRWTQLRIRAENAYYVHPEYNKNDVTNDLFPSAISISISKAIILHTIRSNNNKKRVPHILHAIIVCVCAQYSNSKMRN